MASTKRLCFALSDAMNWSQRGLVGQAVVEFADEEVVGFGGEGMDVVVVYTIGVDGVGGEDVVDGCAEVVEA